MEVGMTKLQRIKTTSPEMAALYLKLLRKNGGKGTSRKTFGADEKDKKSYWWVIIEDLGKYPNVLTLTADAYKKNSENALREKNAKKIIEGVPLNRYPKTWAGYYVYLTKYFYEAQLFLNFLRNNGGDGKCFQVDWTTPSGRKETRYRIAVSSLGKFKSVQEAKSEYKIFKKKGT